MLRRAVQCGSLYRLMGTMMCGGAPMISVDDMVDCRGGAEDRPSGTRGLRVSFYDQVATTFTG